jgi:hypothetical protein
MLTRWKRFSLRWLLIAVAIVSVPLYFFFVRPTMLAERFVEAVNAHDAKRATAMVQGGDETAITTYYASTDYHAEILPRTWSDIWHAKRTVQVQSTGTMNDRGGSGLTEVMCTQESVFTCGPFRIFVVGIAVTEYL